MLIDIVTAKIQAARDRAETLGPHFGPTIRFSRRDRDAGPVNLRE
jgi:hypothetical protein